MNKKFIETYGCILATPWTTGNGSKKDNIIGNWGEDNNEYEIKVPPQLREAIIAMQNAIQREYSKINKAEDNLKNRTEMLNSVMLNSIMIGD